MSRLYFSCKDVYCHAFWYRSNYECPFVCPYPQQVSAYWHSPYLNYHLPYHELHGIFIKGRKEIYTDFDIYQTIRIGSPPTHPLTFNYWAFMPA